MTDPRAAVPVVIRELITTAAGQYFPRTPSTPDLFRFQDVLEAFAAAVAAHVRADVIDEVLRGLKSERDTDQVRAVIASVEFMKLKSALRAAALAPSQEKS